MVGYRHFAAPGGDHNELKLVAKSFSIAPVCKEYSVLKVFLHGVAEEGAMSDLSGRIAAVIEEITPQLYKPINRISPIGLST